MPFDYTITIPPNIQFSIPSAVPKTVSPISVSTEKGKYSCLQFIQKRFQDLFNRIQCFFQYFVTSFKQTIAKHLLWTRRQ